MENKTRITCHRFLGQDGDSFKYEITFNKSLEDTVRMKAMCRGLDRFDKWKPFWGFIHNILAHPFLVTGTKWAQRFHNWTGNKM